MKSFVWDMMGNNVLFHPFPRNRWAGLVYHLSSFTRSYSGQQSLLAINQWEKDNCDDGKGLETGLRRREAFIHWKFENSQFK